MKCCASELMWSSGWALQDIERLWPGPEQQGDGRADLGEAAIMVAALKYHGKVAEVGGEMEKVCIYMYVYTHLKGAWRLACMTLC